MMAQPQIPEVGAGEHTRPAELDLPRLAPHRTKGGSEHMGKDLWYRF